MKIIKVKSWYKYIPEHPKFTGCLIDQHNNKYWYKNGQWHREDGPAVEHANGSKMWCLNGKWFPEQEHLRVVRHIKLKLLDTDQHSL
jgi:hypothetical protein